MLRFFGGAIGGAVLAAVLLLVGLLRGVAALVFGASIEVEGAEGLLPWYVGGFSAAGALVAALWPLRRSLGGRLLLGLLGAGSVFLAIVCALEGPVASWQSREWVGFATCTLVFGLGFAHQLGTREWQE